MFRSGTTYPINAEFATAHAILPGLDTYWECEKEHKGEASYVRDDNASQIDMGRIDGCAGPKGKSSILMHRRSVGMRDEAFAAAGFVHAFASHRDTLFGFKSTLSVVCRLATLHADGVSLGNVFRDG
jgi:hypothetical protein